jgi:hypothetical protein
MGGEGMRHQDPAVVAEDDHVAIGQLAKLRAVVESWRAPGVGERLDDAATQRERGRAQEPHAETPITR